MPPPSRNGSSSSPETEWCPVPPEQRPVNEYEALASSLPFSWAAGDLRVYCSRLALTGAAFALFVGLPVAAFGGRGGAGGDAVHLALGATGSGILAVTLAVVRMYLGWAYVGNRLLSATVECEESEFVRLPVTLCCSSLKSVSCLIQMRRRDGMTDR